MRALLFAALLAGPVLAQDPPEDWEVPDADPAELTELGPPGPAPAPDRIHELTQQVAAGLRCPVCQGMSVADSPAETALTMKSRVRDLVTAGYTEEQIQDFFVARYGEWVLMEPPAKGLNLIVWLAPGIAVGFGIAVIGATVAAWRKEPDEVPLPTDLGLQAKDPYEAQLLAELED